VLTSTGFKHHSTSVLLLAGLLVGGSAATHAQYTKGEPGVGNNAGTALVSSPLVLDATQYTGTGSHDACDKISQAINDLLSTNIANGVVDARGFTGSVYCAESMFPDTAADGPPPPPYPVIPTGKLLLGNTIFWVSSTQVQPTKFQVEGVGWTSPHPEPNGVTGPPSNTIIRACPNPTTGTPCATYLAAQSPGTVPIIWCWGGGTGWSTAFCNGYNTTDTKDDAADGSLTQYISFDCYGLANCVDM